MSARLCKPGLSVYLLLVWGQKCRDSLWWSWMVGYGYGYEKVW